MVWGWSAPNITHALPVPAIFPNLRVLEVNRPVTDAAWLAGLSALPCLEKLRLLEQSGLLKTANAALQLPMLSRLTFLELEMLPRALVQLQLAGLPVLAKLRLDGSLGKAALLTSGPAAQLQRLVCRVGQLSADFSALQGLQSAYFDVSTQLDQAASIAAATAPTCLELVCVGEHTDSRLGMDLLRNLPPSIRCLAGSWPQDVAPLLGALTGLAGLSMHYWGPHPMPLPPVGAPFWARLRAFSWAVEEDNGPNLNLPQVWQVARWVMWHLGTAPLCFVFFPGPLTCGLV